MRRPASPFSPWVLPLRAFGVLVILSAFAGMLTAPDLKLIVAAAIGSLLWQAGTLIEERSPLYRRLQSNSVKDVMRTRPVRVRSSLSVARFSNQHPAPRPDAFIVTTQDGYDAGIATPEHLSRVSNEAARYSSMAQVAQPLSYAHALRPDYPVLEAFLHFRQSNDTFLPVLDRREALAGIITEHDVDDWLQNDGGSERPVPRAAARPSSRMAQKLAA